MSANSEKALKSLLQKNFGKETAREILNMIDKLDMEHMDTAKIEQKLTQLILRCIEKDVNAGIQILSGIIRVRMHERVRVGPLSKAKSKK